MTASTRLSARTTRRVAMATAVLAATVLAGCGWRGPHGPGPGMPGYYGGMYQHMSGPEQAQHRMHMQLMTEAERQEHMQKMQGMKTREECQAYMTQHHAVMAARAKERGMTMPDAPAGPGCGWMR